MMDENNCYSRWVHEQLKERRREKELAKWTLRELRLKAVYKNKTHFINSSLGVNQLKKLPLVLKSDLLKMSKDQADEARSNYPEISAADESYEVLCCFQAILMHHLVTTVHFVANLKVIWTPAAESAFQTLLEAIGDESTGVGLLHVRTGKRYGTCSTHLKLLTEGPVLTEHSILRSAFFTLLPRLGSLQKVRLDYFYCNDWALKQFGMYGKSLVTLQVGLRSDVSSVGLEALSKLQHLRMLLFGEYVETWEQETKFLLLCSQFLPQLRAAGRHFGVYNFNELYMNMGLDVDTHINRTSYHHYVVQQQEPCKLSLEHLLLKEDVQPHEKCQLPELQSLTVTRPNGDVLKMINRYSTISALAFYETDFSPLDLVTEVLQGIGRRLHTLVLSEIPNPFSLSEVLQLCPNVKHLRLDFCHFNDSSIEWPENLLSCLEEVHFCCPYKAPPDFIKQVLMLNVPRLIKLTIRDLLLTKREVNELLDLAWQKRISLMNHTNVSFTWSNNGFSVWKNLDSSMADEAHFNLLLNSLEVAYPHIEFSRGKKLSEI